MHRFKNRLFAIFLAGAMALSFTGCESFDEWEARKEAEQAEQDKLYNVPGPDSDSDSDTVMDNNSDNDPDSGSATAGNTQADNNSDDEPEYTGPSLADYVNEGLEQAKEQGLYKETDYSSIRTDGSVPGAYTGSEYNTDGEGISQDDTDQWTGLLNYLSELDYEGHPYIYVDYNEPYFTDEELDLTDAFEYYSDLDSLGRTQYAFASLNESLMPADGEERGDISSVKPSGWVQAKYDGISNGGWLYNRCHLIAWSLAGENANEKNLMTGTRYFNVEGMLPFEMEALSYLDGNPDNHLLYRATPVYEDDGLLAKGLLLEAYSIEDDGQLAFCVYIFNVQPGIIIDYDTGKSQIGG